MEKKASMKVDAVFIKAQTLPQPLKLSSKGDEIE